jgi:hypothetical protein
MDRGTSPGGIGGRSHRTIQKGTEMTNIEQLLDNWYARLENRQTWHNQNEFSLGWTNCQAALIEELEAAIKQDKEKP